MDLRLLTAGESHGRALMAVLDGLPSGLEITARDIDRELARRQRGHGRSDRMKIEKDRVEIVAGVRGGKTMGGPVGLLIPNRDHENWKETMAVEPGAVAKGEALSQPRPGHGDFAGMLKFGTRDARNVLERASARETAARVAAGALAMRLLEELGMRVKSRVVSIGGIAADTTSGEGEESFNAADEDDLRCPDPEASARMVEEINLAAVEGDTLGGTFEVAVFGVVPGLGSVSQFDRRLDSRLFGALASVPGVKGVEAGAGFEIGRTRGSSAHDEIFFNDEKGVERKTNRAGGLEAGMTNGETVILRAVMKPIPTLGKPLSTVDLTSHEPGSAFRERADVCAVPAAAVVGEAVVALALADAVIEKFGGDSMEEFERNFGGYLEQIGDTWRRR